MSGNITPSQEQVLLQLLGKVMEIMRDDKAVNPDDPDLGNLKSAEHFVPGEAGIAYSFRNRAFPDAKVELTTWTDPLDYSDDRTRVQAVPAYFELWLHNALAGISRRVLEQRLDLANYWAGGDGVREEGNDLGAGPPPDNLLHSYRYRANAGANGLFPVNVDVAGRRTVPMTSPSSGSLTLQCPARRICTRRRRTTRISSAGNIRH